MLYHGRKADDLSRLLFDGGARLIVAIFSGMDGEGQQNAPLIVATRETFQDGGDRVAFWSVEEYMRLRVTGEYKEPTTWWLPSRGGFGADGRPLFARGEVLTCAANPREAIWLGMRYYFAFDGHHDGGLSPQGQRLYFDTYVEDWRFRIGQQWTRLGVPHPVSFQQLQSFRNPRNG
jgi:hypothetical protein